MEGFFGHFLALIFKEHLKNFWLRRLSIFLIDFIISGLVDRGLVSKLHIYISAVWTYIESVVGPTSKLQQTVLVVKREPGDVNLTRRFENPWAKKNKHFHYKTIRNQEYTWGNVGAHPATRDHHIGLISSIKRLARAAALQILFPFIFSNKNIFSDQILNGNI